MFGIGLIVFRESLEAALFVGIVAAAAQGLAGRRRWLASGVAAGVLGALLLAALAQDIGEALDGVGTDALNVLVLGVALSMLLWHCVWVSAHAAETAREARVLGQSVTRGQRRPWALLVAVALAVLREGAETVLFVAGALSGEASGSGTTAWMQVLPAVGLGLLAGAGVGWLMFAGLARVPARQLFRVTNTLLALVAASLASQLMRSLSQAGWLERGTTPLWDSSAWLLPDSPLGTVLHALAGYDPHPTAAQLLGYVAVLAFIGLATRQMRRAHGASPA